jgi:5-methylcytosine-specific restriction endonuclease McrA
MKLMTKIENNGHCLACGKESKKSFCSRQCYLDYLHRGKQYNAKENEALQRELLTDRIVKRNIYLSSHSTIKYKDITPDMIVNERQKILRFREARKGLKHKGEHCHIYFRYCRNCGKLFFARLPFKQYCSDGCLYDANKLSKRTEYRNAWKPRGPFKCKECGRIFQPEFGDTSDSYCCETCRKRAERRYKRYGNSEYLRHKAENNGERFNPIDVLKRDHWTCQLCGVKTPKRLRGTFKDNAPELDHIIPLSMGGEHSMRNTQCLCRKCNGEKGATTKGQLRLFG